MNTSTKPSRFNKRLFSTCIVHKSLYEPDYLRTMKPKYPSYEALIVQIRGYDFPILENYQRYIHKYVQILGINVDNCWPYPAKELKIVRYKPRSTVVDSEYKLSIYERNIKITMISSFKLSLLLEILEASLPDAVTLGVIPYDEEYEISRFVPNYELIEQKKILDELGGPPSDADQLLD